MTTNKLIHKFFFLSAFAMAVSCSTTSTEGKGEKYTSRDSFVDSLLSQMTLKEKIGQMNQYSVGAEMTGPEAKTNHKLRYERFLKGEVGSVLNLLGAEETYKLQKLVVDSSRLGIPLIFAYDVIHGYRTMFPLPLAESSSWDMDAIENSARVAAMEASAAGVNWTFAPMVDVTRDARWGRVMEGAGEDPYLGSKIAEARVRGFQGNDLAETHTIAACAKHFAGYGFAESGKDYNAVSVGRHTLHNYILPPFQAAVGGHVATFMNAFNDIDGMPATANKYLLKNVLDEQWNYEGVVVSDWNSIGEMVNHGTAKDEKDAAKQAAIAGCDIDMEADAYIENLAMLVKNGDVEEKVIDEAVRQILNLKYNLGLFEDPYKYSDQAREEQLVGNSEHLKISREVASKSIVLLKNEKSLLPLSNVSNIGLIGPLVKDKDTPLGNWRANAHNSSAISLYEGIKKRFGPLASISYAEGCKLSVGPNNFFDEVEIEQNDRSGFKKAIEVAKNSDVVIIALGEPAYMSGEARSRADIGLPGLQLELLKEIHAVNSNIILVLMNGRPLTISWEAENIPAILEVWHLGSAAGDAIADVISGDVNPSGKLTMSFPRHVGQLPLYYNHLNTGRPTSDAVFYAHHMDVDNNPLFPFGYGLSYTQFSYDDFKVNQTKKGVEAQVLVSNTGDYEGEEVVQLYVRDRVATISRPVKELKGFEKVLLAPNESVTVKFTVSKEDLSFYNRNGELIYEPGEFEVFVGTNSKDVVSEKIDLGSLE